MSTRAVARRTGQCGEHEAGEPYTPRPATMIRNIETLRTERATATATATTAAVRPRFGMTGPLVVEDGRGHDGRQRRRGREQGDAVHPGRRLGPAVPVDRS